MSSDEIRTTACDLNSGVSAWAFEPLAEQLSVALGDGLFNHVDRDLGDPAFEAELMAKIRDSFWRPFEALRAGGHAR